jgi:hypothetical protein
MADRTWSQNSSLSVPCTIAFKVYSDRLIQGSQSTRTGKAQEHANKHMIHAASIRNRGLDQHIICIPSSEVQGEGVI